MSSTGQLTLSGAATLGACGCGSLGAGECVFPIDLNQVAQANLGRKFRLNSPASFVDQALATFGISVARFIAIRVSGGAVTVRVTSTAGVDQVFDVTDLLVLANPLAGYGVTALALKGVADIQILLTGDA